MTGGSRRASAWVDSPAIWVEYDNPFTTMGAGSVETPNSGSNAGILFESKAVFDWVPGSALIDNK